MFLLGSEGGFWTYIWDGVFEPRVWGEEFCEPGGGRGAGVLGAVVDFAF